MLRTPAKITQKESISLMIPVCCSNDAIHKHVVLFIYACEFLYCVIFISSSLFFIDI